MSDAAQIEALVHSALDEVNATRTEAPVPKDPETVLLGNDASLGSLGLVNLIVASEQRIEDQLGIQVTIASERAFSQKTSPFRTLGSLCDYVALLVDEAKKA